MPKEITAISVRPQKMDVTTDSITGDVDGITVLLSVNYGTVDDPVNHSEIYDLWAKMNAGERTAFQNSVWNRLLTSMAADYTD